MNLGIRLRTDFYNHRKTAGLRILLGEAALWVPTRLWAYAVMHQPDGDFSKYSAAELGVILDYRGDAAAMLQALQKTGFMDEMKIHGWVEHSAFHTKAPRAKKPSPEQENENVSPEEMENIYKAYPRRVAKKAALAAIKRACANIKPSVLLERTIAFAKTQPLNHEYTPHPATWFNQERFNDDPTSWVPRSDTKTVKRDPLESFIDITPVLKK